MKRDSSDSDSPSPPPPSPPPPPPSSTRNWHQTRAIPAFVKHKSLELPLGYRFSPTEEELFTFLRRFNSRSYHLQTCPIHYVDNFYSYPPHILTRQYDKSNNKAWFFLSQRRFSPSLPLDRLVNGDIVGFWKKIGNLTQIKKGPIVLGHRRTEEFYTGTQSEPNITNWRNEEFSLPDSSHSENKFILSKMYCNETSTSTHPANSTRDLPAGSSLATSERLRHHTSLPAAMTVQNQSNLGQIFHAGSSVGTFGPATSQTSPGYSAPGFSYGLYGPTTFQTHPGYSAPGFSYGLYGPATFLTPGYSVPGFSYGLYGPATFQTPDYSVQGFSYGLYGPTTIQTHPGYSAPGQRGHHLLALPAAATLTSSIQNQNQANFSSMGQILPLGSSYGHQNQTGYYGPRPVPDANSCSDPLVQVVPSGTAQVGVCFSSSAGSSSSVGSNSPGDQEVPNSFPARFGL